MRITRTDLAFLEILYRARSSLQLYTVFKRFRRPLAQFIETRDRLSRAGLLVGDEKGDAQITELGVSLLFSRRPNIETSDAKEWRSVPERYLRKQSFDAAFYAPNRRKLDARRFPGVGDKVREGRSNASS